MFLDDGVGFDLGYTFLHVGDDVRFQDIPPVRCCWLAEVSFPSGDIGRGCREGVEVTEGEVRAGGVF